MSLVTITDHNRIDGALEIAHLPGVFISEEVTSYFPEDGCKVHVLVYDINEAQHAEIQKLRSNIFDLVAYARKSGITCAAAHPLLAVNDRLTPDHIEKLLLLFSIFELNGDCHPASNRCMEELLDRLSLNDMQRLADKHKLDCVCPPPWRKYLIAGSDDHSSLNIARNFTRVPGASSVAEFFEGINRGLAETVQRPSSPQNVAHNLYSIAYQFYRHKLNLGRHVPHDFLLRYIDRSLCSAREEDAGLLSRLHVFWQYARLRKIKGSIPGPLVDLLKKETSRLIAEEPDLFALPRKADLDACGIEDRWFQFINKISNRILKGIANHLMDHFSGANLFSIFHTIGSAGGFCTLLAPYFVGFSYHHAQRELARAVMHRLVPSPPDAEADGAGAIFVDSLSEARRTMFRSGGPSAPTPDVVLTCDTAPHPGVQTFVPIGIYEFGELPDHRLVYPPVLEMLDYCFKHDIRRLHLVGAGPTGLAGLFIARLLKLPVEATHTDALPRLVRVVTRDGFIEDLAWKYMVWFYNQVQAVYVSSRDVRMDLEERGVAPDKLRILAPRTGDETARIRRSAGPDVPDTDDLNHHIRRGAI
jgi:hypothetical protein